MHNENWKNEGQSGNLPEGANASPYVKGSAEEAFSEIGCDLLDVLDAIRASKENKISSPGIAVDLIQNAKTVANQVLAALQMADVCLLEPIWDDISKFLPHSNITSVNKSAKLTDMERNSTYQLKVWWEYRSVALLGEFEVAKEDEELFNNDRQYVVDSGDFEVLFETHESVNWSIIAFAYKMLKKDKSYENKV